MLLIAPSHPFILLSSCRSAICYLSCVVGFRLESYSCKLIVQEKRQYKHLCGSPNEREVLAPPISEFGIQQHSPQFSRSASSEHENEV